MQAASETPSAALRTLLRSLGQIVLQRSAWTGAGLLGAWLLVDPRLACAALMGAVAANVSALLAGCREADTRDGLHGFNGALAGLAAFVFIADNATAVAVAILAATATGWLLAPWSTWLRARGLSVFSSPCLIVTWLWLPLIRCSPSPIHYDAVQLAFLQMDTSRWNAGWLAGLAQTGFASGAAAGLLVLLGIAATSRRSAAWALAGAALASAVHLLLGADTGSFDAGLLGFNGALTALALADRAAPWRIAGVVLSALLQAGAVRAGLPAMTAPFVLASWSMQWLSSRPARPAASLTGEQDVVHAHAHPADRRDRTGVRGGAADPRGSGRGLPARRAQRLG